MKTSFAENVETHWCRKTWRDLQEGTTFCNSRLNRHNGTDLNENSFTQQKAALEIQASLVLEAYNSAYWDLNGVNLTQNKVGDRKQKAYSHPLTHTPTRQW